MDLDHDGRRYRILDVLGKGGFGTVYRAEMSSPGGFVKEVALKVVQGDVDGMSEKIARLRDEARLLGYLRHRSIVGVDALTRLGERWAVVMEYVPGVTVRDLLDRYQSLPLIVGLQIAVEIASALHAAWEAQVPARTLEARRPADGGPTASTEPLRLIHRDVKPSNIQLTRHGDVKLLDFGIARSSLEQTRAGQVVYGSVPYLAPERLAGRDTHQADVYALALTLVQMLTGTLPRPGAPPAERATHAVELLGGIGAPADLIAAVTLALDADPDVRPDARAFGLSLKRVQRSLTVFEPRDWSEENVGSLLDARKATAGELTGMSFADGTVSATELFALGKASATFDDPIDSPLRGAAGDPHEQTTSGLVIPILPTATQPPVSDPVPPPPPPPPPAEVRPALIEPHPPAGTGPNRLGAALAAMGVLAVGGVVVTAGLLVLSAVVIGAAAGVAAFLSQ